MKRITISVFNSALIILIVTSCIKIQTSSLYNYPQDPVSIFSEAIAQIQKNYLVETKVKELVFNAVEGMKEEVLLKEYEVDNLGSGWDEIKDDDLYSSIEKFTGAYYYFKENTNLSEDDLLHAAIRGTLKNLDTHSTFMSKEDREELLAHGNGKVASVGLNFTIEDNIPIVISPIKGSPAHNAGIKQDDKIVSIDDKSTIGMNSIHVRRKLRGSKGSKVKLIIHRGNTNRPVEFNLIRDIVPNKSVERTMLDNNIGYVRVSSFIKETPDKLSLELDNFEKGSKLKGLILDLRNNSGGVLSRVIEVADEFIDSGMILSTKGRGEGQTFKEYASKNEKDRNYPVVVLVNGKTAAGAEIVAGALQDNKRALILGTTTAGKGSIQTLLPLSDGSTLKLTTTMIYMPSGRSFHGKGVEPDIVVKKTIGYDNQLMEAQRILKNL